MFYLLGLAVSLTCFVSVILMLGGSLLNFVDPSSFFMIIVPLAAILFATGSFKTFGGGLMAAVLPNKPIPEELRGQAASLFRFLSKVTAMLMGIMTIIGFMNILLNLDLSDPNAINAIGMSISSTLISSFYGLILIAVVFEPVVFILKKRHEPKRK